MPTPREERDRLRRETVEHEEELRDAAEQYERDLAAATTPESRQVVQDEFAAFRTTHREESIRRGSRSHEAGVLIKSNLWLNWAEIAGEQLLLARAEYQRISEGNGDLGVELKASMLTTCAAAAAVEAVCEELKYRVPPPTGRQPNTEAGKVRSLLERALGLDQATADRVGADLDRLFSRRNAAMHPYSELEPPEPHPSGVANTGSMHTTFNAQTANDAVTTMLSMMDLMQTPHAPLNRRVQRWSEDNQGGFANHIAAVRASVGL